MGSAVTVWVTRHGVRQDFVDPDWRKTAHRVYDTPLAKTGFQQAFETGLRLQEENIAAIYASPFLRTVQTAHTIAEVLDLKVYIENGICEALKPEWFENSPDFLPSHILQRDYPTIDISYQTLLKPAYPEPNDPITFERCKKVGQSILANADSPILFVGHGASVEGLVRGLTSVTKGFDCRTCALNKVSYIDGKWRLDYAGVDHLSCKDDELRFM